MQFWAVACRQSFAALTGHLRQGRVEQVNFGLRDFCSDRRHPSRAGSDPSRDRQWQPPIVGLRPHLSLSAAFRSGDRRSWLCYFALSKDWRCGTGCHRSTKLSVVLVAVFAVIFLGERLSGTNWLGVALIAGGAVLVAYRG